jgi:two-component system nitrogen regulation sensor histidine kinase NtrY
LENNEKPIKRIEEMQKTFKIDSGIGTTVKRHMKVWLNRKTIANRLVTVLIGIGAVCGLLTYGAITDVPPFGNNSSALIILLNINLVILLTLVVLVSRRIITLYIKRKKGIVGSNLHIRLVFIFSLLAALPSMFMAIFSVGFFYFGLHGWLDDRVKTAVNESQAVAEAYLSEHQQLIRADMLALASDLDRQASILTNNHAAMVKMLKTQSFLRNFSNIILFKRDNHIVAQSNLDKKFVPSQLPPTVFNTTKKGNIAILEKDVEGITALLKLNNYIDTYAYAERLIDPKVLGHLERAKKGVAQYEELERYSTRLQILLTSIYVVITLLMTIAAVWFGLSFARRLITPITELIEASEKAREGDLSVRVDTSHAIDEFKMLGHAFNRMTETIETQQGDLVETNAQVDFRRRFTETILGGVSTGVMSVNDDKIITLANNAAGDLLQVNIDDVITCKITHVMPEISSYLDDAFKNTDYGTVTTCEIQVRRRDESIRTFLARIVIERLDNDEKGAIVTFDDLTAVLSAQRKAAWADVARRIAHEIKNPLTPIQLSAERLNRKYRKNLNTEDQAIFDQCTETITRHVNDIKTMVNSFADFAKMPDPIIKNANIISMVNELYTLNQQAHPTIDFNITNPHTSLMIQHDEQQIRQVITNLIKNAIEATEAQEKPSINVFVSIVKTDIIIGITDNGIGLPQDHQKLTEPYVTYKEKGTGLGLAIVKKIMEDHHGDLLFNPDPNMIKTGMTYTTCIAIRLPYNGENTND